jgi:hypothetical protein
VKAQLPFREKDITNEEGGGLLTVDPGLTVSSPPGVSVRFEPSSVRNPAWYPTQGDVYIFLEIGNPPEISLTSCCYRTLFPTPLSLSVFSLNGAGSICWRIAVLFCRYMGIDLFFGGGRIHSVLLLL